MYTGYSTVQQEGRWSLVKPADPWLAGKRGEFGCYTVGRASIVPPQVAKRRDHRRPVMAWRPPGAHDDWGQLEMNPLAGARRSDQTSKLCGRPPWRGLCWGHLWILLSCFEAADGDSVLLVADLETNVHRDHWSTL